MILSANQIIGMGIYTLRAGGRFAEVTGILINPRTLKVDGFWVDVYNTRDPDNLLLLVQDVRDMSLKGLIVNEFEDLARPEDLPKLADILNIDYQIKGKKVVGERTKYGTAQDFGVNIKTFEIASISGTPSLRRMLASNKFTFSRRQIKSTNDKSIVINDKPLKAPRRRLAHAS